MADVQAFTSWSTTAASNQPAGSAAIGSGLDDNLREIQAQVLSWLSYKGADLASAATVNIGGSAGSVHDVTGTTTITGLGSTAPLGFEVTLQFDAATPIKHNATSLILPTAATITAAAGDVAKFVHYSAGNWLCSSYQRKSGSPLVGASAVTLGTETATTSGTQVDYTGFPSGTKMIVVIPNGVSNSILGTIMLQLGDSGGIEATGYGGGQRLIGGGAQDNSTGFNLDLFGASGAIKGHVFLTRVNANGLTWLMSGNLEQSGTSTYMSTVCGSKTLSAELDRIRLESSSNFDAGSFNVLYFT